MMRKNVVLATLVALLCTSTVFAEEVNLGKNGDTSTAYTAGGVSIGRGTIGSKDKRINAPIGIGYEHNIDANFGIALGYGATIEKNGEQGIVIGTSSYVGKLTDTEALGEVPHDTPTKVGNQSEHVMNVDDYKPLDESKDKKDTPSIPNGYEGKVAFQSMAIGNDTRVYGFDAVGIGNGIRANGTDSIAIGKASRAWLDESIAMGSQAVTARKRSIALGRYATTLSEDSIAIGNRSEIGSKADSSMALGTWSRVNDKNSVAIGVYSSTEGRGAAIDGTSAFSGDAVKAAEGVVSVGTEGYTMQFDNGTLDMPDMKRRIVNVAGGIKDTDAVNVKQLKAITNALGYTPEEIEKMNAGTGSKPESIRNQIDTVRSMAETANDTAKIAGASAIALSALKPLAYDESHRTQVMAGVGQFKGMKGVALGVGHYQSKDTFYNVGLSMAGHAVSWNAGASFRIGAGDSQTAVTDSYALRIQQLEEKNAELERKVNQLLAMQNK